MCVSSEVHGQQVALSPISNASSALHPLSTVNPNSEVRDSEPD